MPNQRFLIAPMNSGLQRDLRPWLISDDAFSTLFNAYNFRGRVRKRWGTKLINGSQLSSRFRIQIGTTDGAGNTGALAVPTGTGSVGQAFSVGTQIFTVQATGAAVVCLTQGAGTATYDTVGGTVTITGATPLTAVFFYPALPVMGFAKRETAALNDDPTIGWDTQFAYQSGTTGWTRAAGGADTWTGSNSQFFWGANYIGVVNSISALYVVNFNAADGIRFFDGTTWTNISVGAPAVTAYNAAGDAIETARLVLPFKDRLLLFNTIENGTLFPQRCRFSQNGSPAVAQAWREDIPGRGGFIDAPTTEQIVTTSFLKDRLIVYFERSTWEVVYTGNEILPFRWQQIDTELGAESTFSVITFDKAILGIGDVGIHACNGANVQRIDDKIPDETFDFNNENAGIERIAGIRDFYSELAYWAYVNPDFEFVTFPNRLLIYNYTNQTWAQFDDSFTAFGYFRNQKDLIWGEVEETWGQEESLWNSGPFESEFLNVLAGNQEGWTLLVDRNVTRNAPSLQISNLTGAVPTITATVIDHNLQVGDFFLIEGIDNNDDLLNNVFEVQTVPTKDTFTFFMTGTFNAYTGGATIARVSRINILTKEFGFFLKEGLKSVIFKSYFYVDRVTDGQIMMDYFVDTSPESMVDASATGTGTGALIGTSILETAPFASIPIEATQQRFWHPVYFQAEGSTIQFRFYYSDEQMVLPMARSDFQLNAMLFYAFPSDEVF